MFDKFATSLTIACLFSAVLSVPLPQNTGNNNENLQPFAGALGGQGPPAVRRADSGFTVEGNGSFNDLASALAASCDILKTQCTNAAISAAGRASGLTLAQCVQQDDECRAAIAATSNTPTTPPINTTPTTNTPAKSGGNRPNARNYSNARRAAGGNVQTFNGALGGQAPPTVTPGGRGFQVAGGDSFPDLASALRRSCDVQRENCLNAGIPTAQCDPQLTQCRAAVSSTPGASTTTRPQNQATRPRSPIGRRQAQGQGRRPNGNGSQNQQNQQNQQKPNNGNGVPQPPLPTTTTLPPPPPQNGDNNGNPLPPAPTTPANRQPFDFPQ